ncbi:MAG: hypothetical protein AB7N70_27150 [Dehalococcoidia bacterium]
MSSGESSGLHASISAVEIPVAATATRLDSNLFQRIRALDLVYRDSPGWMEPLGRIWLEVVAWFALAVLAWSLAVLFL